MRAEFTKDIVVTDGSIVDARGYGSDYNITTINAAISAIGIDSKILLITSRDWDIDGDLTIPVNITLQFTSGGIFNIGAGHVLTVNGSIDAGFYKIFGGTGTVDLNDFRQDIFPEWFGAYNNGTNATSTRQAIQAALDSIAVSGGTVRLSSGIYLVDAPFITGHYYCLTLYSNTTLIGSGQETILRSTETGFMLRNSGDPISGALPDSYTPNIALRNEFISVRNIHFDVIVGKLISILCISNLDNFEMTGCSSNNQGNFISTGIGIGSVFGAASNIKICNNNFVGRYGIWIRPLGMDNPTDEITKVLVSDNCITGYRDELVSILGFSGIVHDVVVSNNVFTTMDVAQGEVVAIKGYDILRAPGAVGDQQVFNISVVGNSFNMVDGYANGVTIASEGGGADAILDNITISGNTFIGGKVGIYVIAGGNITISNNVLRDSTYTNVAFPYGCAIASTTIELIVTGNVISNWTAYADSATIFASGLISNNKVLDSLTSHGIQIYVEGSAIGNIVSGCARTGIIAILAPRSIIIGNRCNENGESGIRVSQTAQSIVMGNSCNSNVATGILVDNVSSVDNIIAFNNLTNNGTNLIVIGQGTENYTFGNIIDTDICQLGAGLLKTFAEDDATPSVLSGNMFKTANVNPTTITFLDDGVVGQTIRIISNDAFTTVDFTGTNLYGHGGIDWVMTQTEFMDCYFDGTYWYCSCNSITSQTYAATNVTPDRIFDANTVAIAELADIVGTLIVDLRARGIVK